MKRKLLAGLAMGSMIFGMAEVSSALSITSTYTADNIVNSWFIHGETISNPLTLGGNAANWEAADTFTIDNLLAGHDYSIVWQLSNAGGINPTNSWPNTGSDPAAFLGQITGDIVGGATYSGVNWRVSTNNDTWANATQYGTNAPDDPNIWHSVSGIADQAQWIWADGNQQSIFVEANFRTTSAPPQPTPEPATMLLLGSGLAGLAAARRKKKAQA